jgi:hypothetical protein
MILFFVSVQFVFGASYLINGGQNSLIHYRMVEQIVPFAGMKQLHVSLVVPQLFQSPTYNQKISELRIDFQPQPTNREEYRDKRGNSVLRATWDDPNQIIQSVISFSATNSTQLTKLKTSTPFPPANFPSEVKNYLAATDLTNSRDPQISRKAQELTRGSQTEFDAVQRILAWVVDHMRYVLTPPQYDATYSFQTGKGNCQNYSHLAAALMRSVGIPVRIVNGIALKEPYPIQTAQGEMIFKMAQGRHSWIEVWFDDLKWVPFDPQQTQLFVSNRFIRVEVGIDNEETKQDGLIRWSQSSSVSGQPRFEETIDANFQSDRVTLSGEKQNFGPNNLLLTPPVETSFIPYQTQAVAEPRPIAPNLLKQMRFQKQYFFGNLDFPAGQDFMTFRGPAKSTQQNQFEMQKNFLVETAEYVTSKDQYAQIIVVEKPIKLSRINLALHKFGGDGTLWLELFKDDRGVPGNQIATSGLKSVENIPFRTGYNWETFEFTADSPVLSPGLYWIALGFTGSPIINWFYSYGKPVGPQYGTRYKTRLETRWSKSLSFEFNYRVEGLIAE